MSAVLSYLPFLIPLALIGYIMYRANPDADAEEIAESKPDEEKVTTETDHGKQKDPGSESGGWFSWFRGDSGGDSDSSD